MAAFDLNWFGDGDDARVFSWAVREKLRGGFLNDADCDAFCARHPTQSDDTAFIVFLSRYTELDLYGRSWKSV